MFSLDCPALVSLRLSVAAYPASLRLIGMSNKPAGNHRGEDRIGALNAFVS